MVSAEISVKCKGEAVGFAKRGQRFLLIVADLHQQNSAFFDVFGTNRKQSSIKAKSVLSAVQSDMRFFLHLGGKRLDHIGPNVGRIGSDEIEFSRVRQKIGRKNICPNRRETLGQSEFFCVSFGNRKRTFGNIIADGGGVFRLEKRGESNATASRTNIRKAGTRI